MRLTERMSGALLLALACGCSGAGASDAGVDADAAPDPPIHPGCLDDRDWNMDFIEGPAMYSGGSARVYVSDSGVLRILRQPSSTALLTLFERQPDGRMARHDLPADLTPELPNVLGATVHPDGRVAALLSLRPMGGEPTHALATWNGANWELGARVPEGAGTAFPNLVTANRPCAQGSNGTHRDAVYFGTTASGDSQVRMFRFEVDGVTPLGIFPGDFFTCQTTNSGVHVRARASGVLGPRTASTFWDFSYAEDAWRMVGEAGASMAVTPASDAALYDSELGLRLLGVETESSPHATPPANAEQVDVLLYDAPTDGTDTHSPVDRVRWSRPTISGDPSSTAVNQLHVVSDIGGMQHAVYERQGFEGVLCESCDAPPDIEGEYGLRYAVRTDAGWVRKDLLWRQNAPSVFDPPLEILDLVAWHGEIHVLISLHGIDSGPAFIFQSGAAEATMPQGLYDIHSTGCAYR